MPQDAGGAAPTRLTAAEVLRAAQRATPGPSLARLGALHGLLSGLALALGLWLPEALALGQRPVRLVFPLLALGALGVLAVTTTAAWLAARWDRGLLTTAVWAAAALLVAQWAGRLPYAGRNLLVWLLDPRFFGRVVYAFDAAANVRLWVAGFFIALGLVLLGLVQNYRLEGIRGALTRGRLTARAALLLLLPLPLFALAGWAAQDNLYRPLRLAPQLVDEALNTGRAYPGDLPALARQTGVNYGAIDSVRPLIADAPYTLLLGDMDLGGAETVFVVADFANGAWVYCRVQAEQLSHCFDASPPYVQGFAGALSGAGTPGCRPCTVRVAPDLAAWLAAQGTRFSGPPHITRLAQWGGQVLMRAADPAGSFAVECFYTGLGPYVISDCRLA
ncbi:MAG: hypothetical protein IT317_02130 [Anaerolineales bacterium]|nr:hypothetical protein [Anaerolineales bacterium]